MQRRREWPRVICDFVSAANKGDGMQAVMTHRIKRGWRAVVAQPRCSENYGLLIPLGQV